MQLGATAPYPCNTWHVKGVEGFAGVTFYYQSGNDAPQQAPPLPPETPQEVRTPPVITLTGFSDLTLEFGQPYHEMGYSAVDCKGIDITSSIIITNTVDISKAGLYTITYDVVDSAGLTARKTRTVTVEPKPVVVIPPTAPKITINGSNPIILHLTSNTPYTEQMARAVDHDGTDISNLVVVRSGSVNRNAAGTYTLTYSVTSPTSGLTSETTRNVRIVAPTERRDPRTRYGLNGQAKAGGKVTHTGIVSSSVGFMDLKVASIDKNMTITAELINTATKAVVVKDTFSAAGTKQYRIDKAGHNLVVTVNSANGNSKYSIELLMPEAETVFFFEDLEVPLASFSFAPKISPIGSNPIILHLGGTPYTEQGARAVDYLGNNISDKVNISGAPDTSAAGSYWVTYSVVDDAGEESIAMREVRVLAPTSERIERAAHSLSGQGGTGTEVIHTKINAGASGLMDLNVSNLTVNTEITVDLIETVSRKSVLSEAFSIFGNMQYHIDEGAYELVVKINKADGIGKYDINLLMPEVIILEFEDEEVPLAGFPVGTAATYTVVKGDSLWLIAHKVFRDGSRWREIYEMNKDAIGGNPGNLSVGMTLIVKGN